MANGNTAQCTFTDGKYHDGDKNQYYGGYETLTTNGNQVNAQTTITASRWEGLLAKQEYDSAHKVGGKLSGTVTRTSTPQR
jgi:hypothetical protein